MKLRNCLFSVALLSPGSLLASDWPQWQGPGRDAVSSETGLMQQWSEGGPPLVWTATGLGGGDSAPAVVDGMIYGLSNCDGEEIVWAIGEKDGAEVWSASLGEAFEQDRPQSKEGPGGTPTIDSDRLYVVGMGGRVACLNRKDGKIVWMRSLVDDFGGTPPAWSDRESPLVDGDKLICTSGSNNAMVVALDKKTGTTIWQTTVVDEATSPEAASNPPTRTSRNEASRRDSSPRSRPDAERDRRRSGRGGFGRGPRGPRSGAAYSSPIVIEVDGVRQYVQLVADALIGVRASDGKELWRYTAPANPMGINCSTPLYKDGLVFAASAYGTGGGAVKLSKKDDGTFYADEVYFAPQMQNHHGGMIVLDDTLYGANGGNGGGVLTALDFQTGDVLWRDRDAPKGALLLADGRLYLRGEDGDMVLVEPSRDEYVERGRFTQPDRSSSPAWAHPIIANGKLYIRDQDKLYCYDVTAK